MRRAAIALLLILAGGCATPRSPDSPYYVLPTGTRLVLEQPVTVPYPGVTVWLQFGQVLPGTPNRYEPACQLEMKQRVENARTVQPDTFRVTRVERSSWQVMAASPYRQAAATFGRDDDGPMAYEMKTVIYLESAQQPEVFRLTCAHWDRPWFPAHLTVNQIAATLRGLFRIEPAA